MAQTNIEGPGDMKPEKRHLTELEGEKFQYVAIFAMAIGSIAAIVAFVKFIVTVITVGY